MTRDAYLNVRVNKLQKATAEKIFKDLGLTLSDAINVFINKTVRRNGLPFELRLEENPHLSNDEKAFIEAGIESIKKNRELIDLLAK